MSHRELKETVMWEDENQGYLLFKNGYKRMCYRPIYAIETAFLGAVPC